MPRTFRSYVGTGTLIVALVSAWSPGYAAKYAGEFMRLGLGARPWGTGGAYVATVADGTAVYWNPGNLPRVTGKDIMLMHSESFGGLLNYDAVSFALPSLRANSPLAVGFALFRLGGGDIRLTSLANPNQPPSDSNRVFAERTAGHSDWAFYAGLGKSVGSKFDLGASIKIIYRDLVDVSATGLGLDVGATFRPHRYWSAALVAYDITTTLLAYDNGTKEFVNPRVATGIGFTPEWDRFALGLLVDGIFEFEGRREAAQFWLGEVSLDVRWGAELWYRKRVALRGGMNADSPTLGVGLRFGRFSVDGAWRGNDILDDSYRISLSHTW